MSYLQAWFAQRRRNRPAVRRERSATPTPRARHAGLQLDPVAELESLPVGAYAAAPPPAQQIELPVTFSTGGRLRSIAFAPGTPAGTLQSWQGETDAYSWMDLRVIGVKVVAWLDANQLGVGTTTAYTPPLLGITDQRAQCAILTSSMRADGGLDMLPDDQVFKLGGPFGAHNERFFDGLRLQDQVARNGVIKVQGAIQSAFELAALPESTYAVSLRVAVLCDILRDYRLHPEGL